MAIKEYDQQVPKPTWPPKSGTDKPLIKLLVVQQLLKLGRLVYCIAIKEYGHQGVWPTSAQANMATKEWGQQHHLSSSS